MEAEPRRRERVGVRQVDADGGRARRRGRGGGDAGAGGDDHVGLGRVLRFPGCAEKVAEDEGDARVSV